MSKILNAKIYIQIAYGSLQGGAMEPIAYGYMIDGGSTTGSDKFSNKTSKYRNWESVDDYVYARTEEDIWTYVEQKYGCPQCCGWF